jgi:hypothetical protein
LIGYGVRYTAALLNNEGVPSMLGAKWNSSNIAMLLKNPVYCGALVYNKRTSGSLFGMDAQGKLRPKKGKRLASNPQDDWIIEDGVHEPLVSRETFDAAQRAMANRRDAGGKAPRRLCQVCNLAITVFSPPCQQACIQATYCSQCAAPLGVTAPAASYRYVTGCTKSVMAVKRGK